MKFNQMYSSPSKCIRGAPEYFSLSLRVQQKGNEANDLQVKHRSRFQARKKSRTHHHVHHHHFQYSRWNKASYNRQRHYYYHDHRYDQRRQRSKKLRNREFEKIDKQADGVSTRVRNPSVHTARQRRCRKQYKQYPGQHHKQHPGQHRQHSEQFFTDEPTFHEARTLGALHGLNDDFHSSQTAHQNEIHTDTIPPLTIPPLTNRCYTTAHFPYAASSVPHTSLPACYAAPAPSHVAQPNHTPLSPSPPSFQPNHTPLLPHPTASHPSCTHTPGVAPFGGVPCGDASSGLHNALFLHLYKLALDLIPFYSNQRQI